MKRRQFIIGSGMAIGALGVSMLPGCSTKQVYNTKQNSILRNVQIIDAHCHPDGFHKPPLGRTVRDRSSSISKMSELGMESGVFSIIGDYSNYDNGTFGTADFDLVQKQYDYLLHYLEKNSIKIALKTSDIPDKVDSTVKPAAIIGIEGGNCIQGNLKNIDILYDQGVRLITLVHKYFNDLADNMSFAPQHIELPPLGRKVVERMQSKGMVVDVAHMGMFSLAELAKISQAPVIDSHTHTAEKADLRSRVRPYKEVEHIVKTGGVVCTWPYAYGSRRKLTDWADEIVQFKKRFGMEHIGLGTDGGGGLPKMVRGYRDIRDLIPLAEEMKMAGLNDIDIQAFMGGNLKRVLKQCIG